MSTNFYADYISKTTFDPKTNSVRSKLFEEDDEYGHHLVGFAKGQKPHPKVSKHAHEMGAHGIQHHPSKDGHSVQSAGADEGEAYHHIDNKGKHRGTYQHDDDYNVPTHKELKKHLPHAPKHVHDVVINDIKKYSVHEAATDEKKKPASKTPKLEVPATVVPEEKDTHTTKDGRTAKKGLWYNIHQKRKRGEAPAKPGDPDRPSAADLKRSQNEDTVKEGMLKKIKSAFKKPKPDPKRFDKTINTLTGQGGPMDKVVKDFYAKGKKKVDEKLHGDQHKLDHNHDMKITASDMKMVRKKGAVKDHPMEAEEKPAPVIIKSKKSPARLRRDAASRPTGVREDQELEEGTFKVNVEGLPTMYIDGASSGEVRQALKKKFKDPKSVGEVERISPAEKKKELRAKVAEDDLSELSPAAKRTYTRIAARDVGTQAVAADRAVANNDRKAIQTADRKRYNRLKGIERATKGMRNESDQVDELSRDTLGSYIQKASDASKHRGMPTKKVDNRYSGVAKASKKIDKMEEGIGDAVAKVKSIGSGMISSYKKSRNVASPGKGTNILKGESVEEDNNYGPSHPVRKHLKKVGKGGEVEYSHQGKTHKGRYGGLMNRGGRSYAKVHHDTHMAMVPMPQVKYPD